MWDAFTGTELQQLNVHTGRINSVAFSHDGIHIVSGSDDKSVRVWDISTGVALQQLNGHTGSVRSVAFSHDGLLIVSGSSDKSVRVWDVLTDAKLQKLNSHIVSSSDMISIEIWNKMHHGVLWTSTMDGWIVSQPSLDRLMWIPQGIREVIHYPYNILIISQEGYAHIDFQNCTIGTKWMECYKPLCL